MVMAFLVIGAAMASAMAASAQVLATVGAYDEPTQANAVDFVAAGSALNFNQFKSDVATAFTNNFGGVSQCELIGSGSGPYIFSYGTDQTKLLRLIGDANNDIGITASSSSFAQSISLSGLWVNLSPEMSFVFNDTSSGVTNEPVINFGLTVLSTSFFSTGDVTATARFSGGGQASASRSISESSGLGDTFFGFAAPPGQSILSVSFTNNTAGVIEFDDVAFITAVFPTMNLQLIGGTSARIAWPINATSYLLESTTNFPTSTWTSVTNVPAIIGNQFVVTVPSTGGQKFFRLRRP